MNFQFHLLPYVAEGKNYEWTEHRGHETKGPEFLCLTYRALVIVGSVGYQDPTMIL